MSNLIEIVFVLDRSGSMHGSEEDIIGGFNSMINEQKAKGQPAYVSVVLFSETSMVLYDRVPLAHIKEMTDSQYQTCGCTALLDALGDAIHHIRNIHKYARREDVPAKTLFVVMTDGYENASSRYTNAEVQCLVRQQEKGRNWEFIFIGADIDSFAGAASIGVRTKRAVQFSKETDRYTDCFRAVGETVSCLAAMAPDDCLEDDAFCDIFKIFNKNRV